MLPLFHRDGQWFIVACYTFRYNDQHSQEFLLVWCQAFTEVMSSKKMFRNVPGELWSVKQSSVKLDFSPYLAWYPSLTTHFRVGLNLVMSAVVICAVHGGRKGRLIAFDWPWPCQKKRLSLSWSIATSRFLNDSNFFHGTCTRWQTEHLKTLWRTKCW